MSICIYPINSRGPYISKVISNKDNMLVYDGYFYYKDDDLPLQRVMNIYSEPTVDDKGDTYMSLIESIHIEIYEQINGLDTSNYDSEPEPEISIDSIDDSEKNICFFPTEITTLKYRVLKSNMTEFERTIVFDAINDLEKAREKKQLEKLMVEITEE